MGLPALSDSSSADVVGVLLDGVRRRWSMASARSPGVVVDQPSNGAAGGGHGPVHVLGAGKRGLGDL